MVSAKERRFKVGFVIVCEAGCCLAIHFNIFRRSSWSTCVLEFSIAQGSSPAPGHLNMAFFSLTAALLCFILAWHGILTSISFISQGPPKEGIESPGRHLAAGFRSAFLIFWFHFHRFDLQQRGARRERDTWFWGSFPL